MDALDALRNAAKKFFFGSGAEDEPWAQDETVFEEWFGASYEEFKERLAHLTNTQSDLYHRTFEVNSEAAVLWVLTMEIH